MYVGRIMHKDLVTVPPDTSIVRANNIIAEKLIEHLLVVDGGGKLVGIVSDRDLKQTWASPATTLSAHELNYLLRQLTVDMIMVKKIITIPPSTTVERAARIMQRDKISLSDARNAIATQLPLMKKSLLADHVIDNTGSCADTMLQLLHLGSLLWKGK